MTEKWRHCLKGIQKILREESFGENCRSADHLCTELQKGETLCELLSLLTNGEIDPQNTYSVNSITMSEKNIKFFLKNIQNYFELSADQLFHPNDLLEGLGSEKVVHTLSVLLDKMEQNEPNMPVNNEPDAYQHITHIARVVQEWCQWEHGYEEKLDTLLKIRNELLGVLSQWDRSLVDSVFGFMNELKEVHGSYTEELDALAAEGHEIFCKKIGELMARKVKEFTIYRHVFIAVKQNKQKFLVNDAAQRDARKQLEKLVTYFSKNPNSTFMDLYDSLTRQLFNAQNLAQRLEKLVNRDLPEASESVHLAVTSIKRLLDDINEHMRQADRETVTNVVLDKISNVPRILKDLKTLGLHVADMIFKVKTQNEKEKSKKEQGKCFCLLTEKQLIVAALQGKDQYSFTLVVSISDKMRIEFKEERLHLHYDHGKICLSNPQCAIPLQLIQEWKDQLERLKKLNFPPGWNTKPHCLSLTTFDYDTKCTICNQVLEGFSSQGYKCGHCDHKVHADCMQQMRRPTSSSTNRSCADYFHPNIDRKRASDILLKEEVGAFLFREKSDDKEKLVLSIKSHSNVCHIIVTTRKNNENIDYSLENSECWHSSITHLVGYYKDTLLSIHFPDHNFNLQTGVPAPNAGRTLMRNGLQDRL